MKTLYLIWAGLSIGITLGIWGAMQFREQEEGRFEKTQAAHKALTKCIQALEEERDFRRTFEKESAALLTKGWVKPTTRLVAADWLESLRPLLKKLSYTFEPEIPKMWGDEIAIKVTPLILQAESSFDMEVYKSIALLLEKFPGLLMPRDLVLVRTSQGIESKLVFDWVRYDGQ